MAVSHISNQEVWKPVTGYEGFYEVSSLGRVRSLDRVAANGRKFKGKVLRTVTNHNGHIRVMLHKDRKSKYHWVHRLVLEAFVGPRPENYDACHNNGIPGDNRPENLRWGTRSANAKDRVLHGNHYNYEKEKCPRGHLLVQPNLKPADYKRGWRNCLACARAKNTIYSRPDLKDDFQRIADARYEAIMNH